MSARSDVFVVCLQADNHRHGWANIHIVQNQLQAKRKNTYWIPHWPQAGLVPRDAGRVGVRRICYAGRSVHVVRLTETFHKFLNKNNVDFVHKDKSNWNDFSDIDIIIGIRSFDSKQYKIKPATKLYNAWHAGIPFIGGNDSAFRQVGRPGEDYLVARTEKELIGHISRLIHDREFYASLVQNGRKAAVNYTREAIRRRWEDLLKGVVLDSYYKWSRSGKQKILLRNAAILKSKLQSSIYVQLKRITKNLPAISSR
jgi:hypothetical protein